MVKSRIGVIASLLLTALVVFALVTRAQTNASPPSGDHPKWRAVQHVRREACSNKSVGTVCKVILEGRTFSGTCQPTPQEGQLACRDLVGVGGQYNQREGTSVGDLPEQ
jgi:hypothetical protein